MSRFVDQFFTQITGPGPKEGPSEYPSIVFLHGVMGYAINWRRVARGFEDRFRVLAYDARGHGRSSHADLESAPEAYSPEGMAADLDGILSDLNWGPVYLVGHSMGGRVAYTFANEFPNKVRKLVIVDIGPNMSPIGADLVTRILSKVPVPFPDKPTAKAWFATEFPRVFADLREPKAIGDWLYANLTENDHVTWRFHADGIRAAVASGRLRERWDVIEGIKVPTLVIRGEFSNDLPKPVFERMLSCNPNIRGVEIAGAGHWVHSEKFDEFIGALRAFIP